MRVRTDWPLFGTTLGLVFFGLVMVYSASSVKSIAQELKTPSALGLETDLPVDLPTMLRWNTMKQIGAAVLGFLVLMRIKKIDYRGWNQSRWAFAPLGLTVPLVIAAYFFGKRHRWFDLGVFSLQPSEFAKPALILFLAWFICRRLSDINSRYTFGPAAMVIALSAGAVLLADLGTAFVMVGTAAALFYVAGMERRYFLMAGLALIPLLGLSILLKPYRLQRVIGYLDPDYKVIQKFDPTGRVKDYVESGSSSRDAVYQVKQSKIAVGSGGMLGLGLMQGKQKMHYLPEAHTDFIYAVVGEELGLWGTSAVIAGFLVLLYRGLRLFFVAPDDFGRYLALAITVSIVLQALVNISVVLDMAPTKGIPLPLISYGGSSMLGTLLMLGMLMSVSEHSG
ncbi:MAG: FtsW/RodA/SpoVE family cell cycle protein [Bryobacteraceae bacterium]|nr:FtsW/RodA/SpoVE family cell cycle protein [Bryobacteraceae bacterium]